ncbi:MAG TPA: DUF4239 domain-containing protein [Caulobacteraceae bacterium]|jgi:hypothetical protein|nr:DUF4239 domain-containing protein [Caulobacteraceae bacterium]
MSYPAAVLIIVVSVVIAAVGSFVVSRAVPLDWRRGQHAVGSQVFLQLGVMFAVLLAFVFSEVWSEFNTAAMAINGECGALHGASILANALPNEEGKPINRAIATYTKAVVEKEWPEMAARRQGSMEAMQDLRRALDVAGRINLSRPSDVALQSQIIGLLSTAHSFRETRIFEIDKGVPIAMWTVLVLLSLFLIGFITFAGVEDAALHVLFAGAFAGCTVMVLVLVELLDFPFEGGLHLSNTDFVRLTAEVSQMVAGG